MKFKDVYAIVGASPCSDEKECRLLYDWIMDSKPLQCLELGFAYGKTSCVMAAALDELGRGHLTSIDLEQARYVKNSATILEHLQRTGLASYVTPVFSKVSYTWELMKTIEQQSSGGHCRSMYDFIFLDGAHFWEPDSCAFFLGNMLLNPGGWFLFDDYSWTLAGSDRWSDDEQFRHLPDDYKNIPQVAQIVKLLVAKSADYESVIVRDNWAWAHKKAAAGTGSGPGVMPLTKVIALQWLKERLFRSVGKR